MNNPGFRFFNNPKHHKNKSMNRLINVEKPADILPAYRNTPIGDLLEYHNLDRPLDTILNAKMLIGMCMDNRKHLRIPDNFAYIIRTGGANLRYSEFKVSYAIAVGGIRHIAVLAHSNCGMVNLKAKEESFVNGLVTEAGWEREFAQSHFMHFAPMFEIGNEIDFVLSEAARLRKRYPKITIAPLYYRVEDNQLYQLKE